MGWLDKLFSLPGTAGVTSVANKVGGSVSFAVAGARTKVSEAVNSTLGTFGGANTPFTKIGANTPTFKKLYADAMLSGSYLNGTQSFVKGLHANEVASTEPMPSARSMSAATGANRVATVSHLVVLEEINDVSTNVQFDVMPEIVEARTVEYEAVAPPQFPGAFQKYKGTSSTQWTLNVTFVSRNRKEAQRNLVFLNILRGWTMPFYGEKTAAAYPGKLGSPPPVLRLKGLRQLVGPVPVVITSLNWNWPKDVDYISTNTTSEDGKLVPFPAVMNLAIQLVESFSTGEFNSFSLKDYRAGNMTDAFKL